MHMNRPISRLLKFLCLAILLKTAAVSAQEDLVRVSIRPDNENWDWQPYAEKLAGRLATAIDSRVNEGFPRREFTMDSLATVLVFRFRIDNEGRLRRFVPLSPRQRYLAYLIQRAARELGSFEPLPEEFPLFHFDGTMRFNCRMKPTGRYKRLYFEEPLDSLEEITSTPFYKAPSSSTPLILYEPEIKDKNKLLKDFKQRIGIVDEIEDTSSYTPLDFTKRVVAVDVAYDSLTGDTFESVMLKTRIEAALVEAGALLIELELAPKPPPPPAPETAGAKDDSTLSEELPDTSLKESLDSVPEEKPAAPMMPQRDLAAAFASRLGKKAVLVFSTGVAADTVPDKAICRVRLFPSDKPGALKRRVNYVFSHSGSLPDSLGRMVVARLTAPPPKPKPPARPKPKPKAPAAGIAGDSTAVDTTAAGKAARADSAAAAPADTTAPAGSAKPDSTTAPLEPAKTPVTSPTPAKTDTAAAAPDSAKKPQAAPAAAPPDSTAPAGAAIPDSTAAPLDTAKTPTTSPTPAAADTAAAAPDSAKKPQAAPEAAAPADTGSSASDTTGKGSPPASVPPAEAASDSSAAAQDTTAKAPGGKP